MLRHMAKRGPKGAWKIKGKTRDELLQQAHLAPQGTPR
jgi:hypothetical protein